jgi:hypothetical protein
VEKKINQEKRHVNRHLNHDFPLSFFFVTDICRQHLPPRTALLFFAAASSSIGSAASFLASPIL